MGKAQDQRLFVLPVLPMPEGVPQRDLYALGRIASWQRFTDDAGDEIRIVLTVDSMEWRESVRPGGECPDDLDFF